MTSRLRTTGRRARRRSRPFGAWHSPITAELVIGSYVELRDPHLQHDVLYWLEARPEEEGRTAVVRRAADGSVTDVLPARFNARTLVHEYGGGAFWVHDSTVYFTNFEDQRIYRSDGGQPPVPITPEPPTKAAHRYADYRTTPDGTWLVAVRERHLTESVVVNELVSLPTDGHAEPRIVVGGSDLYAAPRLSPDGRQLAWISWNLPDMPWDATELWVAQVAAEVGLEKLRRVAGGPGESVLEPVWSPDGVLHFVSDRTDWWNIYRERDGTVEAVTAEEAEFSGPLWELGMTSYAIASDGRIVARCNRAGEQVLVVVDPDTGVIEDLGLPYRAVQLGVSADGHHAAAIVADPAFAPALVIVDLVGGGTEVVRTSLSLPVDPGYISVPRPIEFPTDGGETAHALYYPPANSEFVAPKGELPPLFVQIHGGPTDQARARLDLGFQFFTSRGFAIVDVDYGGSTGYGRRYRDRLVGGWGVVDVADCVAAAHFLATSGRVDPARMAITGGSAGGFVALSALTFYDVFAAGSSYAGIGDLETLQQATHKFESRYSERLVAPYPERADIYRARSPIHSFDRLSAPLFVVQGLEDEIVPPSQAEAIVAALHAKRVPYLYLPFEGEQHGLRQAANILRVLKAELYFYGRIFGFTPSDELDPEPIAFLDG